MSKLFLQRKLLARSDRVKCMDLHPKEPWMLASLYNGNVHIWNYESQTLVKSFEVTDLPGMCWYPVILIDKSAVLYSSRLSVCHAQELGSDRV